MTGTSEPFKLLVAEDDPFQRKILAKLLTRAGYVVDMAASGEDALAKVLNGQYQILITDWDMPEMDGTSLCRRVRESQIPGYLYILMLTAHEAIADAVEGLEAGADAYLRKPANEDELLARIKAGRRIVELERSLTAANARIERLSVTDALLGCYNRRYLNEQLPREIERARRYQAPLALLMADLDGFKKLNDTHGHTVGDEVLVCFAERAAASLRQASDWIARFGGEEFAIVLPQTDLASGASVAHKVRTQCAEVPFSVSAGSLNVTVSLGVAELSMAVDVHSAMTNLLARADAALYQSKREGRNRVTLSTAVSTRA